MTNLQENCRKATYMKIDALEDGYVDHELFSLTSIKVWFHFYLLFPMLGIILFCVL